MAKRAKGPGKGAISIFGRKDGGMYVTGQISKAGAKCYNVRRLELKQLYMEVTGKPPLREISKAEVVEFLLLGREAAKMVIAASYRG